jgi:hypothetical protein
MTRNILNCFAHLGHIVESNLNGIFCSAFEANFSSRKTIVTSVRLKYRIGCCEINTSDIENGGWGGVGDSYALLFRSEVVQHY